MKKILQRIPAIACVVALTVSVLPATGLRAMRMEKKIPGTPSITVKAVNGTDVKVTIGKTKDAYGYEVWITSDCGYGDYKNENHSFGEYNYCNIPGDYINAATVEEDGSAVRTVTIKNLSISRVSVKVRAFSDAETHYTDARRDNDSDLYGEFSYPKTVKVTAQKKGYKSSYDFSKVKKGDTIKFGTYEQDYPVNGKDPIEWVVLDKTENNIVVVSKYALDCLPYNTEYTDVTWETCSLREWLNGKFYNAAFNKTEKAMISKTTVRNNDNTYYPKAKGGNDTKDKVFLLSYEDVINESYGFNTDDEAYDINRRCAPSKYAVAQGLNECIVPIRTNKKRYTADKKGAVKWWLRTPGRSGYYAEYVRDEGDVEFGGGYVSYGLDAVRPALVLKLKS